MADVAHPFKDDLANPTGAVLLSEGRDVARLTGKRRPKLTILALHAAGFLLIMVISMLLTTWRGALWPFDLRFSLLLTLGGIAVLAAGWGWLWLLPVLAAAILPRLKERVLLWPIMTAAALVLHSALGPDRGFMTIAALEPLDALLLYALPMAMALLAGSALREALR